jgi:hypothetical protein
MTAVAILVAAWIVGVQMERFVKAYGERTEVLKNKP